MPRQSGRNVLIAYKPEVTFNTPPGTGSAKILRFNSGAINPNIGLIESGENRSDGMSTRGRHGFRRRGGGYSHDLSLGSFDDIFEAVMQGTWAVSLTVTQATGAMSSAALSASGSVVTFSAGSIITSGFRVGDVVRNTAGLDAADQNKNLRIIGLTATTITFAESLTTVAGPVATWSFTRPKKLLQGVTKRSFHIEEMELDIDGSELFGGWRWGAMNINMPPNGNVEVSFSGVGKSMSPLSGASSPYFISPSEVSQAIGMTAVDAKIRLGSGDLVDLTSLQFGIDLRPDVTEVIGSRDTPEVWTNNAKVSAQISGLRSDMQMVTDAEAETPMSLSLVCVENESEPKDFVNFHIPNLTLLPGEKSPAGQDNGRTQTFTLVVGKDDRGGAYDPTMVKIQTSAA